MKYVAKNPAYDITKSWEYNYKHGPFFNGEIPPLPQKKAWKFLGFEIISPLGIAAGPLPNSKWLLTYASLGYGSVVQKTVRSSAHKSHPNPNIIFVKVKGKLNLNPEEPLSSTSKHSGSFKKMSITNSFGNPSLSPKVWTTEAQKTGKKIGDGQLFGVSVYGTSTENTSLKQLAQDYAKTALLAKKSGAMFIEANLACPNVSGAENPFLYKDETAVAEITRAIKSKIGNLPLILKIGYFEKYENLITVLKKSKGNFEGISAINTISKKIVDVAGKQALKGRDVSGVCGFAIKAYGISTVKNLKKAKKELKSNFEIIGVGGVMSPDDVLDYLRAGADHVHSATAVMWNPYLAYEFNQKYPNPLKLK